MKKSTKLISLLLALVMLLSIIPMAVAADDGTIVKDGVTLYTTKKPTSFTELKGVKGNAITKNVGENGVYQRLPRDTNIHTYCNTVIAEFIPEYYAASTATVELSDPTVLSDFSYTISGWQGNDEYKGDPCLTFNFTAAKSGTTTVKLTYYYNYNHAGETGYCNGCGRLVSYKANYLWYKQTSTFTVTVGDGEVPTPSKPDKPTESDVNNFFGRVNSTSMSEGAVYMWCDTFDHQAWFDYITDVDDAYTLGDVVANDGSVMSKTTYPWICVMTLDANKYLDAYNNSKMGTEYGTHYLKDGQSETESVTWYWNATKNKWQYREKAAPVYIDITHTDPTPSVTEYTVTYTDGVDGKAFDNQVYTVKEGDPTPAFEGTPARKGYKFLGWEPTVAETVTANATYTAKWEMDIPDVRYVQIRVRCVDPIDSSKHLYIDYGVIPNYGTSKGIEEIDGEYYYTFTLSEAQKTSFIENYDGIISGIVKETCKHVPVKTGAGPSITWKWVNDEWVCQNAVIADHPVAPVVASIDVVCGNIVTFNPDNGEDTFIQSVKFGQKAQKPADPKKDGYFFLGWYAEGAEEPFDFETVIEAPLTLTAKWEEALTDVTVTSNISEGKLLFLGDEFKVTATANTDANLTFNFESNPAFKQITSSSTSNSKTVWYRVVKITGGYTKINVSVTGTKGKQEPVTGTLTFGVNLRNRIHVNIVDAENNVISNIEDIKLIHKYTPSSSKALKYDAAKQEYVMANMWDLSVDDFYMVQFTYDGEVYEIAETTDGTDLRTAIKDGTKEIYVSYKIVAPINVTVEVDGEVVKTEKFKGKEGEKLNYVALYWEVMNQIQAEGKMANVQILIDDAAGKEAIFGTNKNVKIVITTI